MEKKPSRTFTMKDVRDEVIGKGKYYMYGGNVQLYWHKFTPNAGALQFHSIAEALLLKGVHSVEWDKYQEGELLTKEGWLKDVEFNSIGPVKEQQNDIHSFEAGKTVLKS